MTAVGVLLGMLFLGVAHADITVTDDRGKAAALAAPAQRIIALAPFITELVYAAGAGKKLIGVARYSDYPPAARMLRRSAMRRMSISSVCSA